MKYSLHVGLILFFLFTICMSFAQTFSIKAGMNLSTQLTKSDNITLSEDYKMLYGFHVGLVNEIQIGDFLSVETGLLFSTKGFRMSEKDSVQGISKETKTSLNLLYFDIPVVLKVWFGSDNKRTYGIFGPYIGMGLSGKATNESITNGKSEMLKSDIEWGRNRKSDLKRLDYGLVIGGGLEINAIQIGVSYSLGLANIANEARTVNTSKNRIVQISIAYKFTKQYEQ